MNSVPRRRVLALGATAISGLLAGCGSSTSQSPPQETTSPDETATSATRTTAVDPTEDMTTRTSDEGLPIWYGSGTGQFSGDNAQSNGWIHLLAGGEETNLSFNARFCTTDSVEATLSNPVSSEYALNFVVGDGAATASASTPYEAQSCSSGSDIVGGATMPGEWDELAVTVNGDELLQAEWTDDGPVLYELPDPIRLS